MQVLGLQVPPDRATISTGVSLYLHCRVISDLPGKKDIEVFINYITKIEVSNICL